MLFSLCNGGELKEVGGTSQAELRGVFESFDVDTVTVPI